MKPMSLSPADRLIVAADFKPDVEYGRLGAKGKVLALARSLEGTGVHLKLNSVLRACGYDLIDDIHALGLRVFADLKLFDISETLATDGMFLRQSKPELLTVACTAGIDAMRALKAQLPDTEVLGVSVLTTFNDDAAQAMFTCSTNEAVMRLSRLAAQAGVDGLISSAKEAAMLSAEFGLLFSCNTPAIRPTWAIVESDDQNPDRVMTPAKAIAAGADRIVVGRPIVQAANPRDAVIRTLEEIASAVA